MPDTYIEGGKTYASAVALLDQERGSMVSLEGAWVPRIDDSVVGIITENKNHVYNVDLSHFGRALIIEGRYEKYSLEIGDVIEARIKNVEERKTIILSYPKTLDGGVVINVKPMKIPRVIGKDDTMVKQIAEATRTKIVIGYNGMIWIKGAGAGLAIEAISIIESEAHMPGLTERIRLMLEKGNKSNGV
jgi:exosome complex component RRP4